MSQNSLLKGAMWGSLAVFLSKVLGFIYLIPFNRVLEVNQQIVFTSAYRIYAYVLLIATAGIPFATASMIAKYNSHNNYRVSMKLLRSNVLMMITIGVVCALVLIGFAPTFARTIITTGTSEEVLSNVTTGIRIIATALIFVPIVSVVRGFFQGYKEIQTSALSQLVEQLINASFITAVLLLAGAGIVQNITAVYFAVFCATLGSVASLLYLVRKYNQNKRIFVGYYRKGEELGTNVDIPTKQLYKELFSISVPFILVILLAQSNDLIDLFFTIRGLVAHGLSLEAAKEFSTIYGMSVIKLMTIPMTISTGLSVSLVPHLSEAYALKDGRLIQDLILKIITGTVVVLIPVVILMSALALETFQVIGTGANAEYGAYIFRYFAIYSIINTFAVVVDNMMLSLAQRKRALLFITTATIFKLASTYFLIVQFGILGLALSSIVACLLSVFPSMIVLKNRFRVKYKSFYQTIFYTVGASSIMFVIIYLIANFINSEGYVAIFIETGVLYILGIIIYVLIANKLNLIPEDLRDRFLSKFTRIFRRGA